MSGADKNCILARHPFFQGLAERHLTLLADCATARAAFPGDFLMREGEPADHFYLLCSGRVSIELHAPGNASVIMESLGGGDVLGWSWLLPPYRWLFDARVLHDSELIALDAACVRAACATDCELGYEIHSRLLPVMSNRLGQARIRLLDIYGQPRGRG